MMPFFFTARSHPNSASTAEIIPLEFLKPDGREDEFPIAVVKLEPTWPGCIEGDPEFMTE